MPTACIRSAQPCHSLPGWRSTQTQCPAKSRTLSFRRVSRWPSEERTSPAPLLSATVAAVGTPFRSPIPLPKRAPRRVSSTVRLCVAKSKVSQRWQLKRKSVYSSSLAECHWQASSHSTRDRKKAEARRAGALCMERHPIVFLSAWRSAAKRQASNLMLDFPVPSSQKRMQKPCTTTKTYRCMCHILLFRHLVQWSFTLFTNICGHMRVLALCLNVVCTTKTSRT